MDVSHLFPGLTLLRQTQQAQSMTLYLASQIATACCPVCHTPSDRVHGYYWRYPQDLSWAGEATRVWLRVKRFDCCHPACRKATFSENFSTFLAPHAHRTGRLKTQQGVVGLYVGGEMGCTLLAQQNTPSSADSVLRTVKALELPQHPTPRVLGVDDWAFCKGQHYGTILVDLEKRRVVDLLPDRTTASLKTWLEQHPGVEIVTRDRASDYSKAITQAAPQAVQVADRFHLLQNLSQAVKNWLERQKKPLMALLRGFEPKTTPEVSASPLPELSGVSTTSTPTPPQTRHPYHRDREARRKQYDAVIGFHSQGLNQRQIADQSGIPYRTVRFWIQKGHFPEALGRTGVLKSEHAEHLRVRWAEGETNMVGLCRELITQGYKGGHQTVRNFLHALQHEAPLTEQPLLTGRTQFSARYSTTTLRRWVTTPRADLPPEAQQVLALLKRQDTLFKQGYLIVQRLAKLIREPGPEQEMVLRTWLKDARGVGIPELTTLSRGFLRDLKAIIAGVTLPWSNGQVEGRVNKLKFIKRQGYGRASFDLLRRRVLMS